MGCGASKKVPYPRESMQSSIKVSNNEQRNIVSRTPRVKRVVIMGDEKYKDWTGERATFGMSVGFSGGTSHDPTYRRLGDHTETVDIEYDPNETSYQEMLDLFWSNHNPTSNCSRQYMSAIFYHSPQQKALAEASLKAEEARRGSGSRITTKITPAKAFYDAENYHQKYLLQKHSYVLEELDIEPGEELIRSHVAARLNGYLGGHGTRKDFDNECQDLQLPPHVESYVRGKIKHHPASTKG
ncbi:Peptide methionine sulfoxide reductase [Orchesella cincta]|uniref:peptide-methionine (S)-S-oxide reductase n=1 Tax=Orchesella cincta TaxID=48709 RepID=A0A1D2MN06_ORCCI|nr:Peptide methionine sulfoxide reductase [Orchesella cincta]